MVMSFQHTKTLQIDVGPACDFSFFIFPTGWYRYLREGRVLRNAQSGVFLCQLLVLCAYIFLLGILIYAKKFSADTSQTSKNA